MTISVSVSGLDVVARELREIPPGLEREVLRRMSKIAYDRMQAGSDRHTKTGALFRSVYNRSIAPNRREVGHDTGAAPYAPFVVFGTRPHDIRPKNKKALRWAVGGKFVFAKFVRHPGYRGDDYLTAAADEAVRQFAAVVDAALKEQ